MENRVREMFDEVRASDELRMEVLQMSNQENRNRGRRRLRAAGLVAAVLAAVLATSALAVAASPTLRDWFARQWGERTGGEISEGQAVVIESLTQEVGQSAADNGVTVTVDSITVGSDSLWALLEVEGWEFDREGQYTFGAMDVGISPDPSEGEYGGAGYSVRSIGLTEGGNCRMLLEYTSTISTGNQLTDGGYALEILLEDLCRHRSGEGEEILCPGTWTFSIPLTVESLSATVTMEGPVTVAGELLEGDADEWEYKEVTLRDLTLTATGLSFLADSNGVGNLWATAILSDGTEVRSTGSSGSLRSDDTWYCSHQWPVPIDVADVIALRIGDTEIPLDRGT